MKIQNLITTFLMAFASIAALTGFSQTLLSDQEKLALFPVEFCYDLHVNITPMVAPTATSKMVDIPICIDLNRLIDVDFIYSGDNYPNKFITFYKVKKDIQYLTMRSPLLTFPLQLNPTVSYIDPDNFTVSGSKFDIDEE